MPEKIYITGKVDGVTKSELKKLIQPDYKMASGVIKSMKYLVLAEDPGEKRMEKAQRYGIEMVSWVDFVELANLEDKLADARN